MGLTVLFLFALFGRDFYVQVIAAPALAKEGARSSVANLALPAHRGKILDRNGKVLAGDEPLPTVSASPYLITNPQTTAADLAGVLGLKEGDLARKLTGKGTFVYIARKVSPELGDEVKALKLVGVSVSPEDLRVYPNDKLAPQLLGFVDSYNTGIAGIEKQYNGVLAGHTGTQKEVLDREGHTLNILSETAAANGIDLTLTIDTEIQYEAENVLTSVVKDVGAKKACAIVLDPTTGEILAMADTPVFDTNTYARQSAADQRNIAVTDEYEPGSIFKVVTAAAALSAGLVTPDTVFDLGPTADVAGQVVHEAESVPAERSLSVTQILAESSNVGAITLGRLVGDQRMMDMISRFGFTKKTGIDFPGEVAGSLTPLAHWYATVLPYVSMGQSISVTPLQMACAYAAIANNGVLMQPHLVKGAAVPAGRQVISPQVAQQLREMLTVTVESGTGTRAQISGYDVAGKTGTAQQANAAKNGYAPGDYVASFVGMVPANAPRLVILVTVFEPATEHKGALVAAPAFSQITQFALNQLGIAPTH